MTCGSLRPVVLFPPDVYAWADGELRQAVVRELEHVRRGDWLIRLVARTVSAMYSFHPLVWAAWRQLNLEAERACDDAVLHGAEQTLYAQQLVMPAKTAVDTATAMLMTAISPMRAIPVLRPPSPAGDAQRPAFEVTSVKPNTSGDNPDHSMMRAPGGRMTATNVTVGLLIRSAYQDQVHGANQWT